MQLGFLLSRFDLLYVSIYITNCQTPYINIFFSFDNDGKESLKRFIAYIVVLKILANPPDYHYIPNPSLEHFRYFCKIVLECSREVGKLRDTE